MHAESHSTTLDILAEGLPGLDRLGRPVVNQTGLTGNFDFALDWVPDALVPPNADAPPQGASFLAAVREQLGLKLESTKAPVRMLIIDHLERPTEN
jgi:bla regulator protein blaR1